MNKKILLLHFLGSLIGNAFFSENIALNKPAWQQHPYSTEKWGANKAVDGRFTDRSSLGGQCTISADRVYTATWRVDLGRVLSIHYISIFYRTANSIWDSTNGFIPRFLGFSVYVSNTTNKDEGILCFKDTNYTRDTIPENFTTECVQHGRYVIYYNERGESINRPGFSPTAFNELCELQVYGCPTSGFYGTNCSLPCPQNCQERLCNIVNGTCLGCVTGYKGLRCEEECDNNRYGPECNLTCGNCSNVEQCNHVNGSCPNGCDVGVQGDKCNQECPSGRHGKNCAEICRPNCRGCNRFTGVCESGCYPGWKGNFCENECDGWFYGADCRLSCGSCLSFGRCHHINGSCLQGCDRGFQGDMCIGVCSEGRYGYNCQDMCNIYCGDPERCDRKTGQCQNGCQAGWKDAKCDKKCDDGKFGQNCAKSCGVCLHKEQCHHINGSCLNGCDRGYRGINCTQECAWGMYGYGCNETCNAVCFNRTCNAVTGACPQVSDSDLVPTEIDTDLIIGVAVAIIGLSLAAGISCFIFRRKNNSDTNKEQLSLEYTTPNKNIHDKNGLYQELGPRTEISDDGGYQALGPKTEKGEYQELGPRIDMYAGSNDNTGYLEIGQIGQTSPYEN